MPEAVLQAGVASLIACLACGLGVLPLLIPKLDLHRRMAIGYAFAGGMMYAASVFNLIAPALQGKVAAESNKSTTVLLLLLGLGLGCFVIHWADSYLSHQARGRSTPGARLSKRATLVFIAMTIHSLPEGIAVGVGYASGDERLGLYLAIAIAIHNIPEGLAIAIPYRAEGMSIGKCFWLAVLSSLPQPVAAVPAAILVGLFKPLLVPSLGFAAGAMMYLVLLELIPEALKDETPRSFAWIFMAGFGLMLLVQAIL